MFGLFVSRSTSLLVTGFKMKWVVLSKSAIRGRRCNVALLWSLAGSAPLPPSGPGCRCERAWPSDPGLLPGKPFEVGRASEDHRETGIPAPTCPSPIQRRTGRSRSARPTGCRTVGEKPGSPASSGMGRDQSRARGSSNILGIRPFPPRTRLRTFPPGTRTIQSIPPSGQLPARRGRTNPALSPTRALTCFSDYICSADVVVPASFLSTEGYP